MANGRYEWHLGNELNLIIHGGDERRIAKMLRCIADILDLQVGGEFIPEIPWAPKDTFIPEIPWRRDGVLVAPPRRARK
jgi:hypothetical protein